MPSGSESTMGSSDTIGVRGSGCGPVEIGHFQPHQPQFFFDARAQVIEFFFAPRHVQHGLIVERFHVAQPVAGRSFFSLQPVLRDFQVVQGCTSAGSIWAVKAAISSCSAASRWRN